MPSVYEKKISEEVRLICAEQKSLYDFIILSKKTMDTDEDQTTQARHFKSTEIYSKITL